MARGKHDHRRGASDCEIVTEDSTCPGLGARMSGHFGPLYAASHLFTQWLSLSGASKTLTQYGRSETLLEQSQLRSSGMFADLPNRRMYSYSKIEAPGHPQLFFSSCALACSLRTPPTQWILSIQY